MKSSLANSGLENQLENLLRDFIKEKLELIMKEELENFLKVERSDEKNSKNGYYQRALDTRYGKIENLSVPRDRKGYFHTQLFEPYQRRDGWLESAIIKMYQSGMSTREIGQFIERIRLSLLSHNDQQHY
jgi:transposase-like protein